MKLTLFTALICVAIPTLADDAWRSQWDIALHTTASTARLQTNSVLNPANAVAQLAESAYGGEVRINIKLESDATGLPAGLPIGFPMGFPFRLTLRPILSTQHQDNGTTQSAANDAYLSQWQLRTPLAETVSLSIGREVMNWGPAQFRSPSSPFYFDNGRANPSRELSGVDAAKLAWTPDANRAISLAYVQDSCDQAKASDPWRNTWLLKGELRGDDWTAGLALASASGRAPFLGAYAQWTLDEAWLLYGEASSAPRANALVSPANPALPFSLQPESARHGIGLLGAARTFENGHSLSLEYLHNGHGYRQAEADAYFARAAGSIPAAAQSLVNAPPLLGRNYLNLVWQNNLLDNGDYWRLMWSRNLDDASNEWGAYFDHPINRHLNFYALGVLNSGGERSEFAALIERSLTIGLRLALP
jgi:hypothetical protein